MENAVDDSLVLGDADEQVDLTTPLDETEIAGTFVCFVLFLPFADASGLPGIGVKCTQLVMASSDPLKALMHISQNFPKYATAIARRVNVSAPLLEELQSNGLKAQEGVGMVWLNGMVLQETDVNVFR